jgi:hypothetical protein
MGAPGFSEEMLKCASKVGVLAVYFNRGIYHLQPPDATGLLLCHKTGQRAACALSSAQMTEEDVETALAEEEQEALEAQEALDEEDADASM